MVLHIFYDPRHKGYKLHINRFGRILRRFGPQFRNLFLDTVIAHGTLYFEMDSNQISWVRPVQVGNLPLRRSGIDGNKVSQLRAFFVKRLDQTNLLDIRIIYFDNQSIIFDTN